MREKDNQPRKKRVRVEVLVGGFILPLQCQHPWPVGWYQIALQEGNF